MGGRPLRWPVSQVPGLCDDMSARFPLAFILFALLNLFGTLISAAPVGGEIRDVEQAQKNPKCADVIQRREWYVWNVMSNPEMH